MFDRNTRGWTRAPSCRDGTVSGCSDRGAAWHKWLRRIKHCTCTVLCNFTSFSQAALIMMAIIIKTITVISQIYYTCINIMLTRLYLNNSPTSADRYQEYIIINTHPQILWKTVSLRYTGIDKQSRIEQFRPIAFLNLRSSSTKHQHSETPKTFTCT